MNADPRICTELGGYRIEGLLGRVGMSGLTVADDSSLILSGVSSVAVAGQPGTVVAFQDFRLTALTFPDLANPSG